MIDEGETVNCTITQIEDWGVYASTDSGDTIFVNFGEISWRRIRDAKEVLSVGQVVDVLILRCPQIDSPNYLGSIKQAKPESNPWHNHSLQVGSVVCGKVIQIGKDVVYFELPNEIVVGVQSSSVEEFTIGELKDLQVKEIVPERCFVEASIVR